MWALVGKLAVSYVFLRIFISLVKGIYSTFIAHIFRLNLNLGKTGKWAVVTGSTDGIGKAYAFQLAQRGLNIVLISRTASKLQAVATEIKERYPVEIKIIAADFTRSDIYENIGQELEGLDVGVLVNNVGMSYEYPEFLTKYPDVEKFSETLVTINITSVNRMTMMVLPGMEERRRGIIINVSSLSAALPTPLLTLYAATKSYVESFSRSLDLEVKERGVRVQCVLPGFVVTNLSKIKRSSWMVPNPTTYVRQAIGTVGVEDRTGGYSAHKLLIYLIELQAKLLPSFIYSNYMLGHMKQMRQRALKKREREAKAN